MDSKKIDSGSSFNLDPSYGSTVNFSSILNDFTMGDYHMSRMPKGINSLNMSAQLRFTELTDDEIDYAISFLQSKYYNNLQNYNSAGHFDNKKIIPFDFQGGIFSPYKTTLKYFCSKFNHTKSYFNSNELSATFECAYPSILNNVEPEHYYNPRIFHGALSNPAIGASDSEQSVSVSFNIPSDYNSYNTSTAIVKGKPIFASGSYQTMQPSSNATLNNGGSYSNNVLARFGFNGNSFAIRTGTRSSIFLESSEGVYEYPFNPIIKEQNSNGITEINYRMFDHSPSYSFSIEHSPKYKQSNISEIYKRFSSYGFNANLSNLRLEFKERTDEEAKRILLFLESHLGYQKFAFHAPQNYGNDLSTSNFTSPHRNTFSTFVCPEWSHTVSYKNNNSISATFIECVPY